MKAPPNIPKVGEDCELRGKPGRIGSVVKIDHESKWTAVKWPDGFGPHICHLFELVSSESLVHNNGTSKT